MFTDLLEDLPCHAIILGRHIMGQQALERDWLPGKSYLIPLINTKGWWVNRQKLICRTIKTPGHNASTGTRQQIETSHYFQVPSVTRKENQCKIARQKKMAFLAGWWARNEPPISPSKELKSFVKVINCPRHLFDNIWLMSKTFLDRAAFANSLLSFHKQLQLTRNLLDAVKPTSFWNLGILPAVNVKL